MWTRVRWQAVAAVLALAVLCCSNYGCGDEKGCLMLYTNAIARVLIDDKYVGDTQDKTIPLEAKPTKKALPPGTFTLTLTDREPSSKERLFSSEQYKQWSKQITIRPGETTTVYAYREPGHGYSHTREEIIGPWTQYGNVSVDPDYEGVSVYVDGEYCGTTVTKDKRIEGVPVGDHTLTFKLDNLEWSKQATVAPEQTTDVHASVMTLFEEAPGLLATVANAVISSATDFPDTTSSYRTGPLVALTEWSGESKQPGSVEYSATFWQSSHELPREIRAASGADLRTLVWIKRLSQYWGAYEPSGGPAYQGGYEVWLIDLTDRKVIGHHILWSPSPPLRITTFSGSWWPVYPDAELVKWLTSLPVWNP